MGCEGKRQVIRIIVVGSKPSFTYDLIGDFDFGYFANAAISRKEFFSVKRVTSVVSTQILLGESELTKQAKCLISKEASQSTILLGKQIFVNFGTHRVERLSRWHRTKICVRAIGVFGYVRLCMNGTTLHKLKAVAQLILRGEVAAAKPSTGVFCALLAYERHCLNDDVQILVSGIGLSSDGYDYIKGSYARGHVSQDAIYANVLIKRGVKFLDFS